MVGMNKKIFSSIILAAASTIPSALADEIETPEISVLGQSGKSSVQDFVPTVSELSGRKLDKKKQSTLGETLAREAGVSSSQFGPNASRPVIRGLDGERIRILQGGIGTLDASGTSADHSVSLDPLLIERVEIVRGSAALLYGSSAIGGVVNTTTSRIPDRLQYDSKVKFDSRLSSADQGRTGGLVVNSSSGNLAWHLDGLLRESANYKTPLGRVGNSQSESFDLAAGLSRVTDRGYFGGAFSSFGTTYGVVKEQDVTIAQERKRVDLAGEFKGQGFIQSGRVAGTASYYKHEEKEGTDVGTTFRNRGAELRTDLKHAPMAGISGIIGAQLQSFDFSAQGDEAFLPSTTNQMAALFAFEELNIGSWTPTFGARVEFSGVDSEGGTGFGSPVKRSFVSPGLSAGTLYRLGEGYSLGLNTSLTARAPNYQELFAAGPHVATSTFEVGNDTLSQEIGRALELSLRRKAEATEGRATIFVQDFTRFLALNPTGGVDAGSGLDIYAYTPVSAVLFGAEFEYRARLPWSLWNGIWEVEAKLDWVRGRNRTDDVNLPRITPFRESLALDYRSNALSAEIEIARSETQNFLAPNETRTPGYTLLNLGAEVPVRLSSLGLGALRVTARLNNALDAEARNHVSLLKDLAPLTGRNFVLGIQAQL